MAADHREHPPSMHICGGGEIPNLFHQETVMGREFELK